MIASDMSEEPGPRSDGPAPLATRWVLARVTGPSMAPTVRHGDRLLARRVPPGGQPRAGDVVLARFPSRPELLVVKRLARLGPDGAWVLGDNPLVTDDSRAYGPAVVVGVVVARLWPRPGRLPGRLPGPART